MTHGDGNPKKNINENNALGVNKTLSKDADPCYPPDLAKKSQSDGRTCKECKTWKVWNEFGKHREGYNGKRSTCKPCRALQERLRQKGAPNKIIGIGKGIKIELTLKPSETYLRGVNNLFYLIAQQEIKNAKRGNKGNSESK